MILSEDEYLETSVWGGIAHVDDVLDERFRPPGGGGGEKFLQVCFGFRV